MSIIEELFDLHKEIVLLRTRMSHLMAQTADSHGIVSQVCRHLVPANTKIIAADICNGEFFCSLLLLQNYVSRIDNLDEADIALCYNQLASGFQVFDCSKWSQHIEVTLSAFEKKKKSKEEMDSWLQCAGLSEY